MKRWHSDHCQNPQVDRDDSNGTILCTVCSSQTSIHQTLNPGPSRPVPPRTENQVLKWPPHTRYLGEFSSAVEITQPAHKVSRVGSISRSNGEILRPEILFENEIRLVRLDTDDFNGPVHVDWEKGHSSGQMDQEYHAVSYTSAGGSSIWKPVFVGIFWDIVYVHENCEMGLRQIRHQVGAKGQGLLLWVDELCIDLDDVLDRNLQGTLSKEIFKNATSVLVCLGGTLPEFHLVLELLEEAQSSGIIEFERPEQQRVWSELCELPIFSRVWTFHELLMAKKVVLDSTVAAGWAQGTRLVGAPDSTHGSLLNQIIEPYDRDWDLLENLLFSSQYGCSDPRDKVFGILSRVNGGCGDKYPLRPDYSLSVEDVYTGIAAYLVSYIGNMTALRYAGLGRSNLDIPSWVPDWTQKHPLRFNGHERDDYGGGHIEGAIPFIFDRLVPDDIEILIDPKSRELQCSAIRLCSFNGSLPILSPRTRRSYYRAVFLRDNEGNVLEDQQAARQLIGSVPRQNDVSVFLLQEMNDPVLLRYVPEKEAYELLGLCLVGFRTPGPDSDMPWEKEPLHGSDESHFREPEGLRVVRLAVEDKENILDFDSRILGMIQYYQNITPEPDQRTFSHSLARFMDLVNIYYSQMQILETNLKKSWDHYERNLGWMFQDHAKLWAFVEHLQSEGENVRGTEKMPRPLESPTTWSTVSFSALPDRYSWDLERFCLSFVSGSSAPPPESKDANPEDLIPHINDIIAWARVTESILRIMSFTEKCLSSSWPSFPGNDLARTWLAPFETGVWKWERFNTAIVARQRIWAIPIHEGIDPKANSRIRDRLMMNRVGLDEEVKQIRIM